MGEIQVSSTVPRARFGRGIRHEVAQELATLNAARPMVLATPGQADMALEIAADLGERAAGVFTMAAMHTPVAVTEEALAHTRSVGADSLVAVGGGSTIGLAKALALRTDLPQVAIPTTYAGSEATPILGQTENGVKTTLVDKKVLPEIILYDPELVVSLPRELTVSSSLNAMAHAAEGLYARDRTPESTEIALTGLKSFVEGLPNVTADLADLDARERTLRGAWACGTVLGRVGMALHHKLCHTVGGAFDLPHADVHAVILPHAVHFNNEAVPDLLAPLAGLLDGSDPGRALWEFGKRMKAPLALKDLGMEESQIDHAVEISMRNPYWNPREITADGLRSILRNAWAGNPPGA